MEELKDNDSAIAANAILNSSLDDAIGDVDALRQKTDSSASGLEGAKNSLGASQITLENYKNQVNLVMDTLTITLNRMQQTLSEAQLSHNLDTMADIAGKVRNDVNIQYPDDGFGCALRFAEQSVGSAESADLCI